MPRSAGLRRQATSGRGMSRAGFGNSPTSGRVSCLERTRDAAYDRYWNGCAQGNIAIERCWTTSRPDQSRCRQGPSSVRKVLYRGYYPGFDVFSSGSPGGRRSRRGDLNEYHAGGLAKAPTYNLHSLVSTWIFGIALRRTLKRSNASMNRWHSSRNKVGSWRHRPGGHADSAGNAGIHRAGAEYAVARSSRRHRVTYFQGIPAPRSRKSCAAR